MHTIPSSCITNCCFRAEAALELHLVGVQVGEPKDWIDTLWRISPWPELKGFT